MDPRELIDALERGPDGEALYRRLYVEVPQLDPTGQDALWAALKKKADELYRSDLQRGQMIANWMVDLAERSGNPLHRALGLLAQANVSSIGLGEPRQAVDFYDQAAAIYHAHNRPVEEAQSQIGRVYALANLGRYAEALKDGERAAQVLQEHGEQLLLARLLVNLAVVHGRLGQDAEALAMLDQTAELYRQIGPSTELNRLRVQLNRALVLRNLGRFAESIQASQEVLESHAQAGRTIDAARAQQSLAVTYFLQGRYTETLALLDEVRDIFWRDGRKRNAVLVELFLSDCLLQLRRFPDVLEKCQQVRSLFAEIGSRFEVGQALLNEASAYEGLGRFEDARGSLEEARGLFEQEGNQAALAETDLRLAGNLLERGQPEQAQTLAAACEKTFQALDLAVQRARAILVGARAALARNDPEQAAELAHQALLEGEKLFLPDLTYPSYHLLGQVALHKGQPEEGLAAFEQAIRDLELLCGRLMVEYRAGFVENKGSIYEDAVELCLNIDAPERGLEFSERARSRALLNLLAQRVDLSITARSEADRPLVEELLALRAERDRLYRRREGGEGFGQRGADSALPASGSEAGQVLALEKRITDLWHRLLVRSADYARQVSLWQVRTEPVQPYLRPGSLLIEYFTVHGRLVAFLVSEDRVEGVRLPGDLTQIQRLVQLLWLNLRTVAQVPPAARAGLVANLQGILQHFYQVLIAPLAERLKNAERLVIVPHGPLHYLPFHALHDGRGYLLERYEVSYLPGASLLRFCREARMAGDRQKAQGPALLAIGNSYGSRLPFVIEEARSIGRCCSSAGWQGEVLLEEQATLERLRQAAPGRQVLHLAAHGDFRPDNPLFSGLALADGWLTTLDVFNLRLNASLVTLSACQTGRSVVGGGDELLGLMRSFLAAGTASLVSTLWSVEDQSAAEIMQHFYQELARGEQKGAALRKAQLHLLREPPAGRAHPYFWAPFCLTGDDGAL